MEDDAAEPLVGAVDTVKPWTIKSVPTEIRDLAIISARKEGLTIGQWLERRIRAWTEEQSDEDGPDQPEFVPQSNGRPPDHFLAIQRMVNLAQEVAALSPELQKDPVMQAARGTLRAVLLALRPARANKSAQPGLLRDDTGRPGRSQS
jgi:hypothetical protein